MQKKLILVAAPPACGKDYVSDLICESIGHVAYLNKDDLAPLLRRAAVLCNEAVDMDGDFYKENLRASEYETLMQLAFSALCYEDFVLVNAPFLREVRDEAYMRTLKARAEERGAALVLIWVHASREACRERIFKRNSERDLKKLADFEGYAAGIDFSAPKRLVDAGAVDLLIDFDNETADTAALSLKKTLEILLNTEKKKEIFDASK